MIDSGSIQCMECERRLIGLYNESHEWLVRSAKKITKNQQESECLVSELYEYLHLKCNAKLFYGENTYNLYYCNKFLHSRFMNKVKKLNRVTLIGDYTPWEEQDEIEYDEDKDIQLEKAHKEVMEMVESLKVTKHWPQARIWELYWCTEDTLDEVARKTKLSKSTIFLAVKKIRKMLSQTIDNPFK